MNKRSFGLVAVVVGFVIALLSLMADFIGIGSYPGINSSQLTGIVIGLLVVLIGIFLLRASNKKGD
ncbi:MAG: hypothetical protein GX142_05380 [Chloroflexi bacterium]|nr:hypothetical protein [Chloroflexota bacterium]